MSLDKVVDDRCRECGEHMQIVRDYGTSGQALECKLCGYFIEEIDLHETKLSSF